MDLKALMETTRSSSGAAVIGERTMAIPVPDVEPPTACRPRPGRPVADINLAVAELGQSGRRQMNSLFDLAMSYRRTLLACCADPWLTPEARRTAQDFEVRMVGAFLSTDCDGSASASSSLTWVLLCEVRHYFRTLHAFDQGASGLRIEIAACVAEHSDLRQSVLASTSRRASWKDARAMDNRQKEAPASKASGNGFLALRLLPRDFMATVGETT